MLTPRHKRCQNECSNKEMVASTSGFICQVETCTELIEVGTREIALNRENMAYKRKAVA